MSWNGYGSASWRALSRSLIGSRRRCSSCGAKRQLTVDHVVTPEDAPELAYAIANLRVLCASCHGVRSAGQRRDGRPWGSRRR